MGRNSPCFAHWSRRSVFHCWSRILPNTKANPLPSAGPRSLPFTVTVPCRSLEQVSLLRLETAPCRLLEPALCRPPKTAPVGWAQLSGVHGDGPRPQLEPELVNAVRFSQIVVSEGRFPAVHCTLYDISLPSSGPSSLPSAGQQLLAVY